MSANRFDAWRTEGPHRTQLIEDAECRFLATLESLDTGRLVGVVENPLSHTRDRISNSVIAELLSKCVSDTDENDALSSSVVHLLEDALDRIFKVSKDKHPRRFLLQRNSDFCYADHFFHPEPFVVAEIFRRLDKKTELHKKKTADAKNSVSTATHALGIAVTLLVTRSGLCSVEAVLDVLGALREGTPISVASRVSWLTVDMALLSGRQRRRVLMDATCLAACVAARKALLAAKGSQEEATVEGKPPGMAEVGARRSSQAQRNVLRTTVLSSFNSMIDWLWADDNSNADIRPLGLEDLMRAVATLITFDSCPLIGAYALGIVGSTSLHEHTHCALLNVTELSDPADVTSAFAANPSNADSPIGHDPLAGDGAASGLSAEIRSCTPRSGDVDVEGLVRIREAQEPSSTAFWIVSWIHHLATDRLAGTKKVRAAGTVNLYRSSLVERLLHVLPLRLDGLGPDDLFDLAVDVAETAESPAQTTRLHERLSMFKRFLSDNKVISGRSDRTHSEAVNHYEVSARIVSKQSYQSALKALASDETLRANPRLSLEARCFLILAFRFGLRRAEALGLTIHDVGGGRLDSFLTISPNTLRSLKTTNAKRHLPMALLSKLEHASIAQLIAVVREEGEDRAPDDAYLFFRTPPLHARGELDSPAVGLALEAVRLAAQDRGLRAHHLRHSFGTAMVVGELATTLSGGASTYLPVWIRSFRSGAKKFHEHCRAGIGPLTNRLTVVSAALGHGSDETTLQHYVHGLEWFPFTILRALKQHGGREGLEFMPRRSRVVEDRLTASLLGLREDSRFRSAKGEKGRLIGVSRHAQKSGLLVHVPVAVSGARSRIPALLEALDIADLEDVEGRPTKTASRKFAESFLRLLTGIPQAPLMACLKFIDLLSQQSASSGWFLTPVQVALDAHQAVRASASGLFRIEIRSVHYDGKRRVVKALKDSEVDDWLKTAQGTAEARVSLPEGGGTGQRQRHYRTMSWCLQAVMRWQKVDVPSLTHDHEAQRFLA